MMSSFYKYKRLLSTREYEQLRGLLCERQARIHKGKSLTGEHKEKIGEGVIKAWQNIPEATLERRSKNLSRVLKGRILTKEWKQKISEHSVLSKTVRACNHKTGEIRDFYSLRMYANYCGLKYHDVQQYADGKRIPVEPMDWEFLWPDPEEFQNTYNNRKALFEKTENQILIVYAENRLTKEIKLFKSVSSASKFMHVQHSNLREALNSSHLVKDWYVRKANLSEKMRLLNFSEHFVETV